MEQQKTYAPKQVAKALGKNLETIYRWCNQGKIKAVKIGGTWMITDETVLKLLENK